MFALNSHKVDHILNRESTAEEQDTYANTVLMCDRYMDSEGYVFRLNSHLSDICATRIGERPAIKKVLMPGAQFNFLLRSKLKPKSVEKGALLASIAAVRVGLRKHPLASATKDRLLIATNTVLEYEQWRRRGKNQQDIHEKLGIYFS